ncbi:hypothetical protein H5410_005482, partial [Solanum commersonii]
MDCIHPEQKIATNTKLVLQMVDIKWSFDISPKILSLQHDNIFFKGMSLMYFFIEFSIPWIMKWSVEVNNTSDGFPCLHRTFHAKFWSKLTQKNLEGKVHGQQIVDLINTTISRYYDIATSEPHVASDLIPFKQITRKLQINNNNNNNNNNN